MKNSRLVYSTDGGGASERGARSGVARPAATRRGSPPTTVWSGSSASAAARGGKTVTVVRGLRDRGAWLEARAAELKPLRRGRNREDGAIEIRATIASAWRAAARAASRSSWAADRLGGRLRPPPCSPWTVAPADPRSIACLPPCSNGPGWDLKHTANLGANSAAGTHQRRLRGSEAGRAAPHGRDSGGDAVDDGGAPRAATRGPPAPRCGAAQHDGLNAVLGARRADFGLDAAPRVAAACSTPRTGTLEARTRAAGRSRTLTSICSTDGIDTASVVITEKRPAGSRCEGGLAHAEHRGWRDGPGRVEARVVEAGDDVAATPRASPRDLREEAGDCEGASS